MNVIQKAYGYITRLHNGKPQVLVFHHLIPEAGIQIPKGTVRKDEGPEEAVMREMGEETGMSGLQLRKLVAVDLWKADDGVLHERFFYELTVSDSQEEWLFNPTGGGEEDGLTFHFFWISSLDEVELVRGHGDYLEEIFEEEVC